jgi:ABC-type sugar transport system permease subunit
LILDSRPDHPKSKIKNLKFFGGVHGSSNGSWQPHTNTGHDQVLGLLFISPWLIGFLLLAVIPLAMSFYYSFTRYDLIGEPRFIGFENYVRLFTNDPDFWTVIWNTFYYVLLGVPIGAGVAFFIANLLNTDVKGRAVFRSIIYIVEHPVWRHQWDLKDV